MMQSNQYANISHLDASQLLFDEIMAGQKTNELIISNTNTPLDPEDQLPSYSNWAYCYIEDENSGYLKPTIAQTGSHWYNDLDENRRNSKFSINDDERDLRKYYHYLESYYQNLEDTYLSSSRCDRVSDKIYYSRSSCGRNIDEKHGHSAGNNGLISLLDYPLLRKLSHIRWNRHGNRQNNCLFICIILLLLTIVIALCFLLPRKIIIIEKCKQNNQTSEIYTFRRKSEQFTRRYLQQQNSTTRRTFSNLMNTSINESNSNNRIIHESRSSFAANNTVQMMNNSSFFTTTESTTVKMVPTANVSTAVPNIWTIVTSAAVKEEIECQENQFRCTDGISRVPCLYNWDRCDGIQDCSDGSDEIFCDELKCHGNFMCNDSSCVSLSKVCNGIYDCKDGSDESACSNFACQYYEFRCNSGYCIPKEWVCDGEADCPDHEDEYNCSKTCPQSSKFMCPEGWCIPAEWRCNDVADCARGEDELNCSCPDVDQFRCSYGGGCVEKRSVCDGVPNCADGSDEFDCVSIKDDILLISVPGARHKLPVCFKFFTSEHANAVCRQLGYNKYSWLDQIQLNNDSLTDIFVSKFQILPPIGIERIQFAVKSSAMDECSTGAIVSLGCEVHTCSSGLPERSRQKRIVGGKSSEPGDFSSVGVLIHPVKKWACTATIIAPFWLLTSALCVKRTDPSITEWKFIPGNNDPTKIDRRIQTKNVRKFVNHPSYKFKTITADYDVMLVQMEESLISIENTLELSDSVGNVSLACLSVDSTVDGEECVTVGYGYTSPGGYFINKRKNHLKVSVVSRSICNSSDHYGNFLTDRMICAENDETEKEVCSNDEGAPLLCRNPGSSHVSDRWLLKGVLTAHSCGSHAKHPGLYADVFSTRRWILDIIGQGMANQENLV